MGAAVHRETLGLFPLRSRLENEFDDSFAKDVKVTLTGAEETPPVTTSATGKGKISIGADEQFASFSGGNLYVNVHTPDHKSGEIRAQLKP